LPRTHLTVHFSEECWLFLRDLEPAATPAKLGSDVRALLDHAPRIQVSTPSPVLRYAVDMLRLHASELLEYLGATYGALPADDPRRRVCAQCLEAIDDGIRRSRLASS
jgi:hypothetical protein